MFCRLQDNLLFHIWQSETTLGIVANARFCIKRRTRSLPCTQLLTTSQFLHLTPNGLTRPIFKVQFKLCIEFALHHTPVLTNSYQESGFNNFPIKSPTASLLSCSTTCHLLQAQAPSLSANLTMEAKSHKSHPIIMICDYWSAT